MARSTLIILVTWILVLFGLFMVADSSVVDAVRDFGDKWHYLKLQFGWACLGLVGFWVATIFPCEKWEKFSKWLLVFNLLLLFLVLIPGVGSKFLGARRWLGVGNFSFQPAELVKLTLSLYLAGLLSQKRQTDPLWAFLGLLGSIIFLIMLQPDMGTAMIILCMSLIVYFGSGAKIGKLLLMLPIGIAILAVLVIASPYRWARFKSFLDYSHDPLGSSYHIRQALLAIGSGGIFGQGIGQSRQKYEFLPETMTDSIFAIVGEEFGFVGSTVVITTFLAFAFLGISVARESKSHYGANLAVAITSWISCQAFINIAAMTALLPLTGIPMPLVSYGGSSLIISLFAIGILVNVAKNNNR